MAGQLGQINIELSLDQVKFQRNLERAQGKAQQFSTKTVGYLNNIERATRNLSKVANFAFWGNIAGGQLTGLKNLADGYTEVKNRLSLVESASVSASKGLQSIFDISLRTNQSLNGTATVYQKFAQNAESLKISQEQISRLTETVSKAVAVSGTGTASAEAAITQFGQALGSGVLRGDEFNSVMEQAPGLAQALARGMGVTTGELRQMANAGQLTMDVLIPALERAKASVDAQFNTRVLTIGSAFENLYTSTVKWVGELDEMTGASQLVAEAIGGIANHLTALSVAGGGIATIFAVSKLRAFTVASNEQALATYKSAQAELARATAMRQEAQAEMSLIQLKIAHAKTESELITAKQLAEVQSKKLTTALNLEAVAHKNLNVAQKGLNVAGRALGGALSLVGGPMGLITLATTAGIGAFIEYKQKAEETRNELLSFADSLDITSESLKSVTAEMLGATKAKLEQSITVQREEIAKLKDELANLERQASNSNRLMNEQGLTGNKAILESYKKLLQEVAIKKGEVATATQKLEKSERDLATVTEQVPLAEFNSKLQALFPSLDLTSVNVDKIGISLEDLTRIMPNAENGALSITNTVQQMGVMALIVAGQFNSLGSSIQNALSDKAQKVIERNNRQIAINNEKDPNKKNRLKAENDAINSGFDKDSADFKAIVDSNYALYSSQNVGGGGRKSGKGSRGPDYVKQYTDQLTQMEQRLSELKANAQDIALFGQPSQYQEVNKLTQDIATNGEKYAHYGAEGLAKLRDMAMQIDSANQQVAISQFNFDNSEKLQAMEFELTLLGKTRQEQELIRYNHQLDLEASRLKIGMSQENIAKLDEEIAKLKERRAVIQRQTEDNRGDVMNGLSQGLQTIEDQVSDVAGQISNLTVSAFGQMSDALTDFVMTGKADFRGLAVSILRDISKMIIKMMLFNAIKQMASSFDGYSNGGLVGNPEHLGSTAMFYRGGLVGFDVGGYTGDGGKYTPAGIVHKGEYVITKEATARLGRGFLDHLNYGSLKRGFANGGGVNVPALPTSPYQPQTTGKISVKVINNGEPMDATVSQKHENGQMEITVELVRQIAQQESGKMLQQNMRAGGALRNGSF